MSGLSKKRGSSLTSRLCYLPVALSSLATIEERVGFGCYLCVFQKPPPPHRDRVTLKVALSKYPDASHSLAHFCRFMNSALIPFGSFLAGVGSGQTAHCCSWFS